MLWSWDAVPKPAINTVHRPVRYRFGVASPRGDATEASVGNVAKPKDDQKNTLPRGDAAEASVGMMVVAKDRWMTVSPCRDASGIPVGMVAVPKTG